MDLREARARPRLEDEATEQAAAADGVMADGVTLPELEAVEVAVAEEQPRQQPVRCFLHTAVWRQR